jgi:uncharacterized membrane protein
MAEETTPTPAGGSKDVEENKAIAAIGYIGILCLIPLFAKKDSPFAQYHGKQGLILFIAEVILGFVWVIPFLGWAIGGIGELLGFILFIIGLMNALNGKMVPLPVIGQMAEKWKI